MEPETRKSFHLGHTPRQELALKKELDDVALQTIQEIACAKALEMTKPLDDVERLKWSLEPNFVHERRYEHRKTHPIFHDREDIRPKSPKVPVSKQANVPSYNPLDKSRGVSPTHGGITKKYPYTKPKKVTTTEMRQPKKSAIGVLPNPRNTTDIRDLNILVEGQHPINTTKEDPETEMISAVTDANLSIPADVLESRNTPGYPTVISDVTPASKLPKPAIVAQTGTTGGVNLAQRPQPPSKPPSINLEKARRKAAALKRSQREIVEAPSQLTEVLVTEGDDDELDDRAFSENSDVSVRSVRDLVEEAQRIAAGSHQSLRKRTPSPRHTKVVKSKKGKHGSIQKVEKTVRTVDEIISSLKTQKTDGDVETDADKKIKEIMERVMKHANTVLADLDGPEAGADEPGEEVIEDEPMDHSSEKPATASPQPASVEIPPSTGKDASDSIIIAATPAESDGLPSVHESVQVDDEGEDEKLDTIQEKTTPDLYDLKQAYSDLVLAPQVKHEDIVSVHGKVKTFVSKLLEDGRSKKDITTHLANVHDTVQSYMSRYTKTKSFGTKHVEPRVPDYTKHIHYFCTAKNGIQMPSHLANAVRLYHTPDSLRKTLKGSWVFTQAPDGDEAKHVFQVNEIAERNDPSLERQRSAAARAILEEATSMGGMGYSDWKAKAQKLLKDEHSSLTVSGTKADILTDESRVFWSCAPPKMSMRPSHVREHLFPKYYGAEIPEDENLGDINLNQPDVDEETEEGEPGSFYHGDPEDRAAHQRYCGRTDMCNDHPSDQKPIQQLPSRFIPRQLSVVSLYNMPTNTDLTILRKHHSCQDLTHTLRVLMEAKQAAEDEKTKEDQPLSELSETNTPRLPSHISKRTTPTDAGNSVTPRGTPVSQQSSIGYKIIHDFDRHSKMAAVPEGPLTDDQIFPIFPLKRCDSAPGVIDLRDDFVAIPEDYPSAMAELSRQRKQIDLMKSQAVLKRVNETTEAFDITEQEEPEPLPFYTSAEEITQKRKTIGFTEEPSFESAASKPTLSEQALAAGRNYVIIKKENKKKQTKEVDLSRIEDIERFLYSKPRRLERSDSFIDIKKGLPERSLRVPSHVRSTRRNSLTDLRWDEFTSKRQLSANVDQREWARDIWNRWFDQVFPPDETIVEIQERQGTAPRRSSRPVTRQAPEGDTSDDKAATNNTHDRISVITDEDFLKIESLEPLDDETEDEVMMREALHEEIMKVQERIDKTAKPLPFDYCRLGAIERKLGQLKSAKEHLDLAIELEPQLLHAYWQRHLLALLQGKKGDALEDLNVILKLNRNHVGGYVSRAQLIASTDMTMAITNLSQALKLQPTNADIYIKRAEMYEKRDQILLAMEDYAKAYKLDGSLTVAVFRRACFYFKQENWTAAVNDFTEFLKKCPFDASARLLRGQAYMKLGLWQKAVQDLSSAIHHEPNNWEAYYHRACVFRKAMPRQALMDYSMSILINDSEDNIKSLLHRGVLYDAMGRPEDAVPDFEAILKLRKDVAVAHLNLGLIYLTKMDSYQKAIRKFTGAIKCDPTFVRAYVCRAEAYNKIHDHKNAMLDYTRAIHLRPEVPDFYMRRGYMLLKSGKTDLAAYCVRHVSELFADSDLGQSATQQAVVHSFLKNYPKAILALDNAIKIGPNPPLYILLGKTQMKAKLWQDAIDSLSGALEMQKPWKPKDKWPKESAEVNYLIGLCCLELRNYLKAHDAFNQALMINKAYGEAYYQRGVAKLRLKQVKGIQDINKALALDKTIFQAFLTRAAYYGMKGRFSKAILNCNEAIKLKPMSVRAHLYRGALKYHGKSYELAVKDLTKAIKIDNTCALAYFNRAVCYHDSGNYNKALTDYSVVLLLGEQLILKVLINRGLLYLSHGDYKNALHDFLLAARVNDNDAKIRHTLGLCMHKLRQLKEAVAIFTEAISMDQFFLEAYISRGNVFLDYGNEEGIKAAQCDFERALRLNPTYIPARVNLAFSLQMSGKFQQAWTQFTTVIDQDSHCQAAYEGRAIVNLQMSNLFAALQDVNASVQIKESAELFTNRGVINIFMKDLVGAMMNFQAAIKNDPTYSLAYFNAANIYFKNRQFRQAKAYYDQAVQFNEKDESAYVNRAITKVMIKDVSGALKDFSKAIQFSPKSAHIYFNRGNLFASQESWRLAEADYSRALKLQPDDPVTHKRRADVRGKMGLRDEAVADYQCAVQLQARIKLLKSIHAK